MRAKALVAGLVGAASLALSRPASSSPPGPFRSDEKPFYEVGTAYSLLMALGSMPPAIGFRAGIRRRWFELDLLTAVVPVTVEPNGMALVVGPELSLYSLRRKRVRLSHSLLAGALFVLWFSEDPDLGRDELYPCVAFRFLEIHARISRHLWVRISPAAAGFPSLYEATLSLRWEGG